MAFTYTPPVTYVPGYINPMAQYSQPSIASQAVPQQIPSSNANNGLIWVQGESGAKSYLVAPNNSVLLMDSESSRFFIKSADASGMPQPLRVFEYKEVTQKQDTEHKPVVEYVTREEFDKRIAEIVEKKSNKKEVKNDE